MSRRERFLACLKAHRGTPYCAACIAQEIGIALVTVYELIRYFSAVGRARLYGVVRETGKCGPCGKVRSVIHIAS